MDNVGLNETLSVGQRKFYFETDFVEEEGQIITHVYEDGMLLVTRGKPLPKELSNGELEAELKELHRETVRTFERLFYLQKKVWTKKHAPSYNKMGVVFLSKNLYDDAIRNFQEALAIDENLSGAWRNLILAYIKSQRFDEALRALEKVPQPNTEFPDFLNLKGMALLGKKNFLDSVQVFEQALTENENYALAHLNLGLAYLTSLVEAPLNPQLLSAEERKSRCLRHLQRAKPILTASQNRELSYILEQIEKSQTREALDNLLEIHKEVAFPLKSILENEFYLNYMFGGRNKDELAVEQYIENLKKEIAVHPKYPDLHNHLGVAYLIQCRNLFLRALDEFRRAIRLNPTYTRAQKNLKLAENEGKGLLILLRALLK